MTRDTVARETPARRATSALVAILRLSSNEHEYTSISVR
jgi:hypothetical protein